jgi:hypothetical protein
VLIIYISWCNACNFLKVNTHKTVETQHVCSEILSYLELHPDAADNLDGVIDWWLLEQRFARPAKQVESALNILIEKHAVEKIRNPDGTTIYRARRSN